MEIYKCTVCGYFYKPERGDWMSGIPKNTPFEEIPEDWKCPSCHQPKMAFVPVSSDK